MKITPTEYVKAKTPRTSYPAKANPEHVAAIKPYVEKGLDTLFEIGTTPDEAAKDKRAIQIAANELGFAAREVERFEHTGEDGEAEAVIVFIIRPKRQTKTGNAAEPEAE